MAAPELWTLPMRIEKLIEKLQAAQQAHGDIEVGIRLDIDYVSPRIMFEKQLSVTEPRPGEPSPCLTLEPFEWR